MKFASLVVFAKFGARVVDMHTSNNMKELNYFFEALVSDIMQTSVSTAAHYNIKIARAKTTRYCNNNALRIRFYW